MIISFYSRPLEGYDFQWQGLKVKRKRRDYLKDSDFFSGSLKFYRRDSDILLGV